MASNDLHSTGMRVDALVGKTGFVGRSLLAQHDFSVGFDRANIHEAHGQHFGTLVCAAAPGSMFEANLFPDRDRQTVDRLIGDLQKIRADRMVLISTIAVLANSAAGETELTTAFEEELAYGRNRRRLEEFCHQTFSRCLTIRLPALFGRGLRKNFLFDILNPIPTMLNDKRREQSLAAMPVELRTVFSDLFSRDVHTGLHVVDRNAVFDCPVKHELEAVLMASRLSAIEFTHPGSRFQYYDMANIWTDICRGLTAGLQVMHCAPEPIDAGRVYTHLSGKVMPPTEARLHIEDMRTNHANLWNVVGTYSVPAEETLVRLLRFYKEERVIM